MNKKESIYAEGGWFNFQGWLDRLDINHKKNVNMLIMTSPRNNGKTFSCWKWIEKQWIDTNYDFKVAICRTNDLKMKEAIKGFKDAFKSKYLVENGFIYKYELDEKKKVKDDSKIMIGRFVNVMNEHNYRSAPDGGFKGFKMLFWDEFNEDVQVEPRFFQKFNMLISTVERFNKPFFILLLGNKIYANNDIFTNFNLNVSYRNLKPDFIQKVSTRIVYCDVGLDTYKNLGNKDLLANEVASFNENTNQLFNEGGFLEGTKYNVLNHQMFLDPKPQYYFSMGNYLMEYGTFRNDLIDDQEHYYLKSVKRPFYLDLNIIALDVKGYAENGMTIDKEDLSEIANILFQHIQNRNIYYSSFELMLECEKWIFKNTTLFNE